MLKKSIISILIFVVLAVSFGCSSNSGKEKSPNLKEESKDLQISIVDSMDREVILDKIPKRVISVAPSITETVVSLGGEELLVGRTDYCDYPERVKSIDSIGSLQEVNIEKIVSLKPDVVLASTHFKKATLDKLEKLEIPVVMVISQESFEGVYKNIELVGKVLDKKDTASEIISEMKNKVENVEKKVEDLSDSSKKVYYVVSYSDNGNFTATGDTFISEMIEMAGGENIAKDGKGWNYSLEKLVKKDPDIIICDSSLDITFNKISGFKELKAVKNNEIYFIDSNLISRMGPRLADGLLELSKIIYPSNW